MWRVALAPGMALDWPRLFLFPNLIGLGLFAFLSRHFFKLSFGLAAGCCLVFPVALFGFRSALQDFFVNIMMASAMLLLLYPRRAWDSSSKSVSILPRELFGIFLLAVVANIKFQGFFMAFLLMLSWLFFRWKEKPRRLSIDDPIWGRGTIWRPLLAVLLCVGIAFQPLHNMARFGNPFYPIKVGGLTGSVEKTNSPIQYLPKIPILFNAASFVVSSTEIDPIIRSEAGWSFKRSWHNFNRPKPEFFDQTANHPWVLSGGSNGLIFSGLAVGALLTVIPGRGVNSPRSDSYLLIFQRRLICVSLLFVFLPQVMELRYYMVILFIMATVSVSSERRRLRQCMPWLVVVGLWFLLFTEFLRPTYFWMRTGVWSMDGGLLTPDPYARVSPSIDCESSIALSKSGKKAIAFGKDAPDLLRCYLLKRSRK